MNGVQNKVRTKIDPLGVPLVIINSRNGQTLSSQTKMAGNVLLRSIGLMGQKGLAAGNALLIYPCKQIHSWFMRFPFDSLFINEEGKIVYIIESMRPWSVSPMIKSAWAVVELPAGTIQQTDTKIHDTLEFTSKSTSESMSEKERSRNE